MSNVIRQYLESQQYNTVPDETYSHIDEWLEWYQNDVKKFHHYKVYNGAVTTEQERFRLGMAKTICEDWANLLLNEKVSIKAGDYSTRLEEVLASNKFRVNGNRLIELAFALGTGAFVEYMGGDDEIIIDYIRADMIYPLSWDNGEITECAFGSTRVVDGKERVYLQIHRFGNPEEGETADSYYLENKYLDAESGKEIEPPEDIIPLINTGSRIPLFQILTPNIYNNIDMDSPLGVSVFSNAISQLKGCDVVYDSYINEFILGRKRILVPIAMAKIQMEKEGIRQPTFDSKETVYYDNGVASNKGKIERTSKNIADSSNEKLGSADTQGTGSRKTKEYDLGVGSNKSSIDLTSKAIADSSDSLLGSADTGYTGRRKGSEYDNGLGSNRWGIDSTSRWLSDTANAGMGSSNTRATGESQGGEYVSGVESNDRGANAAGASLAENADSGARSYDGYGPGSDFGSGFTSGIRDWFSDAVDAATSLASKAFNAAKRWLDEHSPSRKTRKVGQYFSCLLYTSDAADEL